MRIIRAGELREGRWRNGMGVSWDIAAEPPSSGIEDFDWRFAIARIDANVPFSHYPGVDRYFTLIEGQGLDLEFDARTTLAVGRLFVPHAYPCDVPAVCRLHNGPCRALNLFLKRGCWSAEVAVVSGDHSIAHDGPVLHFALDGAATVNGEMLAVGDTALTHGRSAVAAGSSCLYVARLSR
jgi:uncharacterized protein